MRLLLLQRFCKGLEGRLIRPTRVLSHSIPQCRYSNSQEPMPTKQRYDPTRTKTEWLGLIQDFVDFKDETDNPLLKSAIPSQKVSLAEETIRWLITEHRFNEKGVVASFKILDNVVKYLSANPHVMEDSYGLFHWYGGQVPRATHLLNALLDCWKLNLRRQSSSDLPSPQDVLEMLFTWRELSEPTIAPSDRSYSIIMQAAVQARQEDVAEFCESIVMHMIEHDLRPDVVAITTAMNAWAKSGEEDAGSHAYDLFVSWMKLYDEGVASEPPNTITYNTLLEALCAARKRTDVAKADQILRTEMIPNGIFNDFSLKLVMVGWTFTDGDIEENADRTWDLVRELLTLLQTRTGHEKLQVNSSMFSEIISFLARSGAEEKAEELYNLLLELSEIYPELRPDPRILRSMSIVYSKTDRFDEALSQLHKAEELARVHNDVDLLPKASHYRDLLQGWVQMGTESSFQRAEDLLRHMVNIAMETRNRLLLPNRADFAHFLRDYARRGEMARRAHELLSIMNKCYELTGFEYIRPGKIQYQQVLQSWERLYFPEAVDRMEALIQEMIDAYEFGGVEDKHPSKFHYQLVISALSKAKRRGFSARCLELFNHAYESSKMGNKDAEPDLPLYGAVVKALTLDNKAEEAESVFKMMVGDSMLRNYVIQSYYVSLVVQAWIWSGVPEGNVRANEFVNFVVASREAGAKIEFDGRTRNIVNSINSEG